MPISFQCPQCGKKLKAPDEAAGKSSKCPGCGGTVTCPELIYDAELFDESQPPSGHDPYADLDGETPYGVVEHQPSAGSSPEGRRPCPMCGEMILTTAAKCRYCGEVFDPALKKRQSRGGKGGTNKEIRAIAVSQRHSYHLCADPDRRQCWLLVAASGLAEFSRSTRRGGGGAVLADVLGLQLHRNGLAACSRQLC